MSEKNEMTAQTSGSMLEQLECTIIAQNGIMAHCIIETGKALKAIKDGKAYAERGYQSFDEYMQAEGAEKFCFKTSQAYKYIRVYEKFGNRLEDFGSARIEVLDVLRDVPAEEIEAVSAKLPEMTEAEAKKLRDDLLNANEQISLLSSEKEADAKKIKALEEDIEEYEGEHEADAQTIQTLTKKLKAAENRAVEVSVREPDEEEIKKLTEKAVKDAEKSLKKQMDDLKKAHKKALETAEAEKKAEADAKAELEKKVEELSGSIDAEKAEHSEKLKALEAKLQSAAKPADAELIEFKFYFAETQENLKKFIGALGKVSDKEKQTKFRQAAITFVSAILDDLKKEQE